MPRVGRDRVDTPEDDDVGPVLDLAEGRRDPPHVLKRGDPAEFALRPVEHDPRPERRRPTRARCDRLGRRPVKPKTTGALASAGSRRAVDRLARPRRAALRPLAAVAGSSAPRARNQSRPISQANRPRPPARLPSRRPGRRRGSRRPGRSRRSRCRRRARRRRVIVAGGLRRTSVRRPRRALDTAERIPYDETRLRARRSALDDETPGVRSPAMDWKRSTGELQGVRAAVLGSTSGIGRAVALALAAPGPT